MHWAEGMTDTALNVTSDHVDIQELYVNAAPQLQLLHHTTSETPKRTSDAIFELACQCAMRGGNGLFICIGCMGSPARNQQEIREGGAADCMQTRMYACNRLVILHHAACTERVVLRSSSNEPPMLLLSCLRHKSVQPAEWTWQDGMLDDNSNAG